jgi:hypothetical protein
MNPFVNPKKRSISLPHGCKDLTDVLQRPKRRGFDPIRSFVLLLLMEAHQTTELIIGSAPDHGDPLIKYKVGDTWRESAFPSDIRSSVIAELQRMAGLPASQFPSEGGFSVRLETTRLKWRLRLTSPNAFSRTFLNDMRSTPPNKITGANAGGPCQLPIRTRRAARIAQFCRWAT